MGTNDGMALSATKIDDSGPNDSRLNIVLVAEGFQRDEQDDFDLRCDQFVQALHSEPWFVLIGQALHPFPLPINVHRINVESIDSARNLQKSCEADSLRTFFDARFCRSDLLRLLDGDRQLVRSVVSAFVPEWHFAGVIVNSTKFGGSGGGSVFWTTLSGNWTSLAFHEMAHSAFGLADEYSDLQGSHTGGEPHQPNITAVTERIELKWKHLVAPDVPIPTMKNPNPACSTADSRPNVLDSPDTVGLFEGAGRRHCGLYRPAFDCKMRTISLPFCRVCVQAIADRLDDYVLPPPSLVVATRAIATPSAIVDLDFGAVAPGTRVERSAEVRNTRTVWPGSRSQDIAVTSPNGHFAFAPGTETRFTLPTPIFEESTAREIVTSFRAPMSGGPSFFGEFVVSSVNDPSNPPVTVRLHARAATTTPPGTPSPSPSPFQ